MRSSRRTLKMRMEALYPTHPEKNPSRNRRAVHSAWRYRSGHSESRSQAGEKEEVFGD